MNQIPLYIIVRRFVDNYDGAINSGTEGDFNKLLDFLQEYKKLLDRVNEIDVDIDSGLMFLKNLPSPESIEYYNGTILSNLAEVLFDKDNRLLTFFKENRRAILDPLTNYLDFIRRGAG